MDNNLIILRYQENFADNLSAIAYGKILSKNNNKKCYYENSTEQRDIFEKQMTHFNTYFDYISKGSVNRITKEAFLLNNDFFYDKKSKKHIKKDKRNRILDLKYFNIDDIDLIDDDIKKACSFKNLDFIINYDILENIKNTNSVGLYINKKDIENDDVDFDYIERAQKRLNKYLKKPRLFIFVDRKYNSKLKLASIKLF